MNVLIIRHLDKLPDLNRTPWSELTESINKAAAQCRVIAWLSTSGSTNTHKEYARICKLNKVDVLAGPDDYEEIQDKE